MIPSAAPDRVVPNTARRRALAIASAALFLVSSAFPVVAGLVKDTSSFPRWWGVLDVTLAFVLALMAMAVVGVAQDRVDAGVEHASYRAYRVLLHGILLLCAAFFIFGERIAWTNCLTGFAWRAWLLLYCLPAWLAAIRDDRASTRTAGPPGG